MKSLKYFSFILVSVIGIFYQGYAGRMYDSRVARFTTPDPMGQYASSYVYCGNNPLRYVDPTGLWAVDNPLDCIATEYRVNGQKVFDDGVDNGLVVNTTLKIIGESTVNGITNWDDVRNNAGSDVQQVDGGKYLVWANAQLDILKARYGGKVSVDGKGNFSVSQPMGVGTMMGMTLGPVAVSEIFAAVRLAGIDFNKLNHIFANSDHHLQPVIAECGGQVNAYKAILSAAQKAVTQQGISGRFNALPVQVGNSTVRVTGNVMNGVARVGTAYIP